MKLTSISEHSDFLQSLHVADRLKWHLLRIRIAFGRLDLNISMFVPAKLVDGEWVVLEEPKGKKCCGGIKNDCYCRGYLQYEEQELIEYQTALSNVLFEGFKIENYENQDYSIKSENIILNVFCKQCKKNWFLLKGIETIENILKYNLTLTATAKKQLGL